MHFNFSIKVVNILQNCTNPVNGALGAFTSGTILRLFPLGHPPLFFCSGGYEIKDAALNFIKGSHRNSAFAISSNQNNLYGNLLIFMNKQNNEFLFLRIYQIFLD